MIKLENVSKYYHTANSVVPALRKINLELRIGEFVAITGESGSGKSTLLNVISGMDTYDDGELYIAGEETSYYDERDWEEYRKNKMGFVYQNYNLIDNYSSLYNVESALLIQGYGNKEARKTARELLKRVGLGDRLHQKASHLSSGQKQRLSIARALAKNTEIIVADEPTANLDSETGKQIMELFHELSKDKLVIVVTHNYEEAAPYATRKLRIHDGEVVSDEIVEHGTTISSVQAETAVTKLSSVQAETAVTMSSSGKNKRQLNSNAQIARNFAWMNISTQPRRLMFFAVFLLITAAVTYIFLGEIYRNWDDTFTKTYDDSAFAYNDPTRIVVKNKDNSEITAEDLQRFRAIKNVKAVDQYGFADDINYYIKKGRDYSYSYSDNAKTDGSDDGKSVQFLNGGHYMKSSTCINEKDLSSGQLPINRNEVVLYSADQNDLGKVKTCYFTCKNTWVGNQYYVTKVKIVGLLKKQTEQVYFSGELSNMLSVPLYGDHYTVEMCWDLFLSDFQERFSFIPVINDEIKDDGKTVNLRVSQDLILGDGESAPGKARFTLFKDGKSSDAKADYKTAANIEPVYNPNSSKFVEMSKELFYKVFQHQSRQASLYMRDYIDTDSVLKKLSDMGYVAISTFRTGSVEYDKDKVAARNSILVKAIIVLFVTAILEFVIIRSIFQINRKDYFILKSMGMNPGTIRWMNLYEMLFYTVVSLLLVPISIRLLSSYRDSFLTELMKYYNPFTYFIYIAINVFAITVTVLSFNSYLKRRQKWS